MDLIHVVILSIVEGITEFLPISSTGHLVLTSRLLDISSSDFLKTFEIAIQSGAVFAVLNLYWKKLLKDKSLIYKSLVALSPTIIAGIILYPLLKSVLLESVQTVSIALIIGGFAILFIERYLQKRETKKTSELSKVTYKQAFFTGLTQSIAIIPGVSRALASIFGGMFFGMDRKTATEFSFILALPTILAAVGYDLIQTAPQFDNSQVVQLVIGIALSFIVAQIAIKWLLSYISNHTFTAFGWYRIIIGLLFLMLFL